MLKNKQTRQNKTNEQERVCALRKLHQNLTPAFQYFRVKNKKEFSGTVTLPMRTLTALPNSPHQLQNQKLKKKPKSAHQKMSWFSQFLHPKSQQQNTERHPHPPFSPFITHTHPNKDYRKNEAVAKGFILSHTHTHTSQQRLQWERSYCERIHLRTLTVYHLLQAQRFPFTHSLSLSL